jgi:hypothetical protein
MQIPTYCTTTMRTATGAVLLALTAIAGAVNLPQFPPAAIWRQPVDTAALHPDSAAMLSRLTTLGGFGFGRMQIDFGFYVLYADANTPVVPTVAIPNDLEPYYDPDCEPLGSLMPMPANGAIEGQAGYSCTNIGPTAEDCHLLVVRGATLFENYRSTVVNGQLQSQCLVKWNLAGVYGVKGRGEHCSSADAAGFPIASMLFNADEVTAAIARPNGDLGHAIRFILPNLRMANDASLGGVQGRLYVHPATHAGGPTGPVDSVPYGSRLRLKQSFVITPYNPAAQVILRTLKRYGMVLSDGGSVALTAENDRYTTAKWADLGINSRTFDQQVPASKVNVSDFEIVDTGARIGETYDCVREPEPSNTDTLFQNGFEQ